MPTSKAITIRAYTDLDWEAVRNIYDLAKPDEMRGSVDLSAVVPLSNDPAHLALFRESSIIVAVDNDEVIGFAGHKHSYISWLYVHPTHRRQGVATLLLSTMLQDIPEPVTLNVGKNNVIARAFYDQFGFVIDRDFAAQFNGREVEVLTLLYKRP